MKLKPQQIVINFEFGYGKTPDTGGVRDFNHALYERAQKTEWLTFTHDQLPKITLRSPGQIGKPSDLQRSRPARLQVRGPHQGVRQAADWSRWSDAMR